MNLTIELVPKTCWYSNVRSNVSPQKWDRIRKKSYSSANNICEICSDNGKNQGFNHNVECHEIWEYDDLNKIQKLIGFISLCPLCHKTKHVGLAQIKGELHLVIDHISKINNMTPEEVGQYITDCFKIWNERSKHKWNLDIKYIDSFI